MQEMPSINENNLNHVLLQIGSWTRESLRPKIGVRAEAMETMHL